MEINDFISLQAKTGVDPATARSQSTSPGRDEFLQMLLAQLENQDPLNPQDATEFTAQLATFSMLEQLVQISAGIGRLEQAVERLEPAAVAPVEDES
ncbi:hypothetical protein KJ059_04760 [Myxococcota bacterium]|nr:hypothetical protein [Myxococcota bacterium]MCZ7617341.1 hypothetical protein [Myxococcota bacterium]